MKVYTKTGDSGTTGLLFGGRVAKDSEVISANGDIDEAQSALGLVRAELDPGSELGAVVTLWERDLWILMAEVATMPENRSKLVPGKSLVTPEMVDAIEKVIDGLYEGFEMPTEFVVPGQNRISALLDFARTVVRRAERSAVKVACEGSLVVPYLNRLSDALWTAARWQDGVSLTSRTNPSKNAGRAQSE